MSEETKNVVAIARAAREKQRARNWTAATENGPLVDQLLGEVERLRREVKNAWAYRDRMEAKAIAEEREACAEAAEGAMGAEGTDCPHKALEWAARAIRGRGKQDGVACEEFRPCPFCGSRIVGALTESSDPGAKLGVVGCGCCGASGPDLCESGEYVAQWNQRRG